MTKMECTIEYLPKGKANVYLNLLFVIGPVDAEIAEVNVAKWEDAGEVIWKNKAQQKNLKR